MGALEKLVLDADSIISAADGQQHQKQQESSPEPAADVASETSSLTEILPGFPAKITGNIVFCAADNINTDGIYPGKYTYQDGITPEKMAEVVMENYDPSFASIAQPGDVLVSGFNFGCGSSREQAATALLAKGIPLVVSGSFGNIFSRNSINNGLLGVEVPKLVERLREKFGSAAGPGSAPLTVRTDWTLTWDVERSKVVFREGSNPDAKEWEVSVGSMPPNVQEIVAKGGLEKWVKSQL